MKRILNSLSKTIFIFIILLPHGLAMFNARPSPLSITDTGSDGFLENKRIICKLKSDAQEHSPEPQFKLGNAMVTQQFDFKETDRSQGINWVRKAATQNYHPAKYALALWMMNGSYGFKSSDKGKGETLMYGLASENNLMALKMLSTQRKKLKFPRKSYRTSPPRKFRDAVLTEDSESQYKFGHFLVKRNLTNLQDEVHLQRSVTSFNGAIFLLISAVKKKHEKSIALLNHLRRNDTAEIPESPPTKRNTKPLDLV